MSGDTSGRDDDRRNDARTRLTLKVEYPSADGFLQDYTVNISRGGTMLRTQRQIQKGDWVAIVLSFPGLVEPLSLSGEVRWVRTEDAEEQTVGVAFDLDEPGARARLEQLVETVRAAEAGPPPAVRILVVEDNPHVARLIREGLAGYQQRAGDETQFQVVHAQDGKEALSLLLQGPQDLLIVDIYLPVMDGGSLIRTMRKDPRWQNLPIIAVSAGADDARQIARRAGADFFLDKPFRMTDVIDTMRRLLANKRASGRQAGR